MILIDTNQVFISGLLSQISSNKFKQLEEDLIRHIVLNTLRSHIKKFKSEYGDVVLCLDSRHYWRKQIYPYYKAHRKESREKSSLDWNLIFKVLNELKEDLKNHFPYRVIEVDSTEADDIIGTLTPRISPHEKVLIISSDKDFVQLQKYSNVKQYNPMMGVFVTSKNPVKDLKEKIIRGDAGDGIPNFLSEDEVFVLKNRQKPISSKKLNDWLEQDPKDFCNEEMLRNYKRNQMLIDFDYIPEDIRQQIISEFDRIKPATKQNLYKYFVSKKLISLLECIEEF